MRVTHLPGDSLERVCHAQINHLHLPAGAADDVVMVMIGKIDLVAIGAVAKVATPHDIEFLHRGKTAIHRDEVTFAVRQLSKNLLSAEWAMLRDQHRENRLARSGDTLAVGTQSFDGELQLMLRRRMRMMGHQGAGYARVGSARNERKVRESCP